MFTSITSAYRSFIRSFVSRLQPDELSWAELRWWTHNETDWIDHITAANEINKWYTHHSFTVEKGLDLFHRLSQIWKLSKSSFLHFPLSLSTQINGGLLAKSFLPFMKSFTNAALILTLYVTKEAAITGELTAAAILDKIHPVSVPSPAKWLYF